MAVENTQQPNLTGTQQGSGLGATHGVGGTSSGGKAPDGDSLLFQAMLAMTIELNTLSDAQVSVAKLSSALYDHMVPNTTNKLQDLQNKVNDYSWLIQNWSKFEKYFASGGTQPSLGPGMSKADLSAMKDFYNQNGGSLTAARTGVGLMTQEVSVQNSYVEDVKVIPDDLQQNQKDLENSTTQYASMIPQYLQMIKEQFTQSWR